MNRNDVVHKIMTTPESYKRLKNIAQRLEINFYKDYFLMFDECDKII